MALKKLCKKAGCNRLATYPHKYCELHQYLEREEEERKANFFYGQRYETEWRDLYNDYRWKEASKRFLKENDLCVCCGDKATVVDHIIPHRGNIDLFYDENNWQPLCKECHDRKTRQEIASRQKAIYRERELRRRNNIPIN